MTVLDQIIDGVVEDSASNLLRKLLVLAHRLSADELKHWVRSELNGYAADADLPDYRGPFDVQVRATFTGPMGSSGTNMLSPHGVPERFSGLFEVAFRDPLAAIESLAASDGELSSPWDATAVALYNRWSDEGKVAHMQFMGVYSAQRIISLGLVTGVVDIVRTKALELALDLQSKFPDAGEKDGPTVEDPAVHHAVTNVTNHIYGPVGNLAQGSNIHQRSKIKMGDLTTTLAAAGDVLSRDGLEEFKSLITVDTNDGEKRSSIKGFVESVREGSVALVSGIAANVAADRLLMIASQFLGWS